MSPKIDAREVLKCLNDLGYTNITAHQLKEFIKDLKKLMKYEERLEKSRSEQSFQNVTSDYPRVTEISNNISSIRSMNDRIDLTTDKTNLTTGKCSSVDGQDDIFNYLYARETIASEAKKSKPKEKIISVQIKRPHTVPREAIHPAHCIHCSEITEETETTRKSERESDIETTQQRSRSDSDMLGHSVTSNSNMRYNDTMAEISRDTIDDDRPQTYRKSCKCVRPKTSFIRPRFSKTYKTDPVALYHQYQEEWKRQKIPGEDSRADLRWAIRERMLGASGSLCCNPSTEILKRKRNNPCQA